MTGGSTSLESEGTRLFVYGTLLASAKHPLGDVLRGSATLIGPGSIQGRLYMIRDRETGLDAYPGAAPSPLQSDRVHGELYALTGDVGRLLRLLDDYENCSPDWPEPHEFKRHAVSVAVAGGRTLEAIAYLYNWKIARGRRLSGGRFMAST